MVYKYQRKTNQGNWDVKDMENAIREATAGSINAVASKYGIPYATLYRHIKKGSAEKKLGRFKPVFSPEQEKSLLEYIKTFDEMFYGLTREDLKTVAFDFAEKNNIPHPFKNGKAGDEWLMGFKNRHPTLTLRTPEPTSIARATGFNKVQVDRFYDLLWETITKYNIDATRLYNMDETGVQSSTKRPPKIFSITGKRQVGFIASGERGQLTTVICCCNAAGAFIPPFLIFGRKRMKDSLLDNAPPGTQATCTDNGWINADVFLIWLQFFVETVRPSADKKVLLLLDNHEAHKFVKGLDYASENNVIVLSFAPHTTHKMQPLDIAVYGPMKTFFEQSICSFQKSHCRKIQQDDMATIFAPAYLRAATSLNAIKGFKSAGIWPFNRQIFGDEEFAPAECNIPTQIAVAASASDGSTLQNGTEAVAPVKSAETSTISPSNLGLPGPSSRPRLTLSPFEIRPLPKCEPIKRRRNCQTSELLTSTPVKQRQREKYVKKNERSLKEKRQLSKNLFKSKPKPATAKRMIKDSSRPRSNSKYTCQVCDEQYVDPPEEDWIMCSQCNEWSHESCTKYSGRGSYFCDECFD